MNLDNPQTDPAIAAEYVSENGTAYVLQVQRIKSQDNNAFDQRGISTPFTLYTIFTGPKCTPPTTATNSFKSSLGIQTGYTTILTS